MEARNRDLVLRGVSPGYGGIRGFLYAIVTGERDIPSGEFPGGFPHWGYLPLDMVVNESRVGHVSKRTDQGEDIMAVRPERKKFEQFRVTVKKQARRHVGESGWAVAQTPHGLLIQFDKHGPDFKEVFSDNLLTRN